MKDRRDPALLACVLSLGLGAQAPVEGPLDNDTEVRASSVAAAALRQGDEALAKLDAKARDERALVLVFESWRKALVQAELDAVVPSAAIANVARDNAALAPPAPVRAWQTVESAVEGRVRALGEPATRAFAARFEGLAQSELDAAGTDARALARVAHEHPFTRAARVALLRGGDLAFESGEVAAARAAWDRATGSSAMASDPALDQALAARRAASLEPARARSDDDALDSAARSRSVATIATGARGLGRHLRPDLAFDDAGTAWIQCGESLVRIGTDLSATTLAIDELCAPFGLAWEPSFGEDGYDWRQRPAVLRNTIVLVCGRATRASSTRGDRRERGNALIAVRDGQLAWGYAEAVFREPRDGGSRSTLPFLPGRLEFQHGPIAADGAVLVLVRQWGGADKDDEAKQVDEGRTTVWLVALDARDGHPRWMRALCTGSDWRARSRERFEEPRGVSWPSDPLALAEGNVCASTGLGVAALFAAADGRPEWIFKSRRARGAGGVLRSGEPRWVEAGSVPNRSVAQWLWAPADGDRWVYRLRGGGPDPLDGPPAHVDDLAELIQAERCSAVCLVRGTERFAAADLDLCTGARVESLPIQRAGSAHVLYASAKRVVCVAGSTVDLLDRTRELARIDRLTLPFLERESACGFAAVGKRCFLAGVEHAWVLEVEGP